MILFCEILTILVNLLYFNEYSKKGIIYTFLREGAFIVTQAY